MTKTATKPQREFTGRHMLAIMIAFFTVIVSVNVFMAMESARTWTGLVVQNSYVASQEFNSKLSIAREREAAGWQGGLAYDNTQLHFTLTDQDGTVLPVQSVMIDITRPIGVKEDQTVELTRQSDGSFALSIALAPGAWNAAIFAQLPDQPEYEHRARLLVTTK